MPPAKTAVDATCPSMTTQPRVAGQSSHDRAASLPGRWSGRSSHETTAPARQSGMASRSITNSAVLSRTDTPGGSRAVPPNAQ